jgi:hypothetical protein
MKNKGAPDSFKLNNTTCIIAGSGSGLESLHRTAPLCPGATTGRHQFFLRLDPRLPCRLAGQAALAFESGPARSDQSAAAGQRSLGSLGQMYSLDQPLIQTWTHGFDKRITLVPPWPPT